MFKLLGCNEVYDTSCGCCICGKAERVARWRKKNQRRQSTRRAATAAAELDVQRKSAAAVSIATASVDVHRSGGAAVLMTLIMQREVKGFVEYGRWWISRDGALFEEVFELECVG